MQRPLDDEQCHFFLHLADSVTYADSAGVSLKILKCPPAPSQSIGMSSHNKRREDQDGRKEEHAAAGGGDKRQRYRKKHLYLVVDG
jgi:hypothetical protein